MVCRTVVLIVLLSTLECFCSQICPDLDDFSYRLPNNSHPIRYDLELATHIHLTDSPKQFDFEGKVAIKINVTERTWNITLNYRRIIIENVKLTKEDRIIINDNCSYSLDNVREFLVIDAQNIFEVGVYDLEIVYKGELRSDNAGFYRSSYVDNDGKTRWLATTQFSSTDARHAFPCYDEPGIRAPIGLTLTYGKNMTWALSNMPVDASFSKIDGYYTVKYEDTPSMQTYLLAIIVCDFVKDYNTEQGVYARYNALENGEGKFALEAGTKILKILENYLEVPYSLPKIEQVAIPDFAAGAMENWGLVTYKEQNILFNKKTGPMSQMKEIAGVIGHEYGHQFFGNLVSPEFWSYLWLKEGFARFFEYHASDIAYPEMKIIEMVGVEKIQNAFVLDALESTRPMTHYVETQEKIANLFDDIAYDKSGSVLRMFQHAFGNEVFRLGLKNYLEARQFKFGNPDQLAEGLQKAADKLNPLPQNITVRDVIKSWSEQKGFPVVFVGRLSDGKLRLTQERYLLKSTEFSSKTVWKLPYNMATAQHPDFTKTAPDGWLLAENDTISPSANLNWTSKDWVILNKQQTGYYRVNYGDDLWELIIIAMKTKHDDINNLNRAQLIDDSFNLARSNRLKYDIPLELGEYLQKETNYIPFAAANSNLGYLNRMMSGSKKYNFITSYFTDIFKPIYDLKGFEEKQDEVLFDKLTRDIAINWMCQLGSKECLKITTDKLKAVMEGPTTDIAPNLKGTIYCNGLRTADEKMFKFFWGKLQKSGDQGERVLIISSLGCSEDPKILKAYLESTVADESDLSYRGQERNSILTSVYSNGNVGMNVALEFFNENMDKINELYNKGVFGGRAVGRAIFGMGKRIVTEEQNKKFEDLITNLEAANYVNEQEISRAREQSSENMEWVKNRGEYVEKWLDKMYNNGGTKQITFSATLAIFGIVLNLFL